MSETEWKRVPNMLSVAVGVFSGFCGRWTFDSFMSREHAVGLALVIASVVGATFSALKYSLGTKTEDK